MFRKYKFLQIKMNNVWLSCDNFGEFRMGHMFQTVVCAFLIAFICYQTLVFVKMSDYFFFCLR